MALHSACTNFALAMKILFAGDASNMHNCLAQQLRTMGHEATVASDGSRWMDTHRDINLLRQPGLLGSLRYLRDIKRALPLMTGYDIVEIETQATPRGQGL